MDNLEKKIQPFNYLRNTMTTVNNPTIKKFQISEDSHRDLALGVEDYFPKKRTSFKLAYWGIALIVLLISTIIVRVQYIKTKPIMSRMDKNISTKYAEEIRTNFEKISKEFKENITREEYRNNQLKKEMDRLRLSERELQKTKEMEKKNRNVFSEDRLNSFVSEISKVVRLSEDINRKVNNIKVKENEDFDGVKEVCRECNTAEDIVENFEKMEKMINHLKMVIKRVKESQTKINKKILTSKLTKNEYHSKTELIRNKTKNLKNDIELLNKLKAERFTLIELISDTRISLENIKKNYQKNMEIKETIDIEYQITQRNINKRDNDIDFQRKSINRRKKDIIMAEENINKTKIQNIKNSEQKTELLNRKAILTPSLSFLNIKINEEESKLRKLNYNKKEFEVTLKTMKSFNELLEGLKMEIDDYSLENNKERSRMNGSEIEQQRIIKIKEREDVIKRIRLFQENAIKSLREIFTDKATNFDNMKDLLENETIKITKNTKEVNLNLKKLRFNSTQIVMELKKIEKEILNLSDQKSINDELRLISDKKDEINSSENIIKTMNDEINTLRRKLKDQEKSLKEQIIRLEKLSTSKNSLEEKLLSMETQKTGKEKQILQFINSKKQNINQIEKTINDVKNLENKLKSELSIISSEKIISNNSQNEMDTLFRKIQQLSCRHNKINSNE